jgi:hypothetical protein
MGASSKISKSTTGALLVAALLWVYFSFDPVKQALFPKCPSLWLTGWKCPGCGSQRALHSLLHGNVPEALQFNSLFVLSLPYVLFGFLLEYTVWGKRQFAKRRRWYGRGAALVALAVVLVYWGARNVWGF